MSTPPHRSIERSVITFAPLGWKPTECTCFVGVKGSSPSNHATDCDWRQQAEYEMELDSDAQRERDAYGDDTIGDW